MRIKHTTIWIIAQDRSLLPQACFKTTSWLAYLHHWLPKVPHHPAKAKSVIFLYMDGGISQVDSFDPKPRLAKKMVKNLNSKPMPLFLTQMEVYSKAPGNINIMEKAASQLVTCFPILVHAPTNCASFAQ